MLSTFFAEVIAGSTPFPFFHPLGIFIVFPLYFLHTIVLSTIVFRFGKPWLYALYLAGMIFGMYEAYMTKVLWFSFEPTGPIAGTIGGVGVGEFLLLVTFWHPVLAFIVPLVVGEMILTKSRETVNGFPLWLKQVSSTKGFFILAIVLLAIFQTLNSPSPFHSLASALLSIGVIAILALIWRKKTRGLEYNMRDLLPNRGQFKFLLLLLILDYILTSLVLEPEKIPNIMPQQLSVWIIYVFLILTFIRAIKISRSHPEPGAVHFPNANWKRFLWFVVLYIFIAGIAELIFGPLAGVFALINTFTAIGMGMVIFGATLINVFKRQNWRSMI